MLYRQNEKSCLGNNSILIDEEDDEHANEHDACKADFAG